jgi:cytidylate kinase
MPYQIRKPRNVALSGRSGAGKTAIAEYLAHRHGYRHLRSGALCRRICLDLFGVDSKEMLNAVTDAMRSIRSDVWISAALRPGEGLEPIAFDSMRFATDYQRLKLAGFALWRVEARLDVRVGRLGTRGQEFDPAVDDRAAPELELDHHEFDYVIANDGCDLGELFAAADSAFEATASVCPAPSRFASEVG